MKILKGSPVFSENAGSYRMLQADPYHKCAEGNAKDCGKGVTRPLDYTDVDGLITNEEGVILATFLRTAFPFILWM